MKLVIRTERETMTSLELVDKINELRKEENNLKELRHDNLVRIIRQEFKDEKGVLMVKETQYIHPQNKQTYIYYELDFYQVIQLLMKESIKVRQGIIKYIKYLENQELLNEQYESMVKYLGTLEKRFELNK